MLLFSLFSLRSFPVNSKLDGFFKNMYSPDIVKAYASGSRFCWINDLKKDILTKPENILDPQEKYEWCSNFNSSKNDKPWLSFELLKSSFTLKGYSIKSGCCYYSSCCCKIFSWSIQGSNDNKTWSTIHKQEKNEALNNCQVQTFSFSNNKSYKFIRIIQDEPQPRCWYCMDISRLEIYGDYNNDEYFSIDETDSDEEVSIIGKVTQN